MSVPEKIPMCKCGHDMLQHSWAFEDDYEGCKRCDCEEFEQVVQQ